MRCTSIRRSRSTTAHPAFRPTEFTSTRRRSASRVFPDSKHFFMVWIVDHLIPDQDTADALETALDNDNPPIVNGKNFAYVNQAVSYVQNNLAVPEPSSLTLDRNWPVLASS